MANNNKGLTKVERLYRILKDGKRHSAAHLAKVVGHRFGAYISDLRDMGFHINTATDDGINYTYQLTAISNKMQTGGTQVDLYSRGGGWYGGYNVYDDDINRRNALVANHGAPKLKAA